MARKHGVPEDRADIVVAGGAILLSLLDTWSLDEFYTSRRNILDGLLAR
jgi:exopolyphosphatase/pppGpp-phosphohydrolase